MTGLETAGSMVQCFGVHYEREREVLAVQQDYLALRVGYLDGFFLVNIGVNVARRHKPVWLELVAMTEAEFAGFLRNALPLECIIKAEAL